MSAPYRYEPDLTGTYAVICTRSNPNAYITLEDTRANDGVRLEFDFDRDGWRVLQPKQSEVVILKDDGSIHYFTDDIEWIEVYFCQAWKFEEPQ